MLFIVACGNSGSSGSESDLTTPWTATATQAAWLTTNPYADKHDGGWVYSAREDRLYAIYGNEDFFNGLTLYRIDHIGNTSTIATTFQYGRSGSHPVIDDTGTWIYMPPSALTDQFERYNTVTHVRETLEAAPDHGTYSHGAWKNGKLWIVLDNRSLYSYDPATGHWSAALLTFSFPGVGRANVASSGTASNLIYIIVDPGDFYSYDVDTGNNIKLANNPTGFEIGGNVQFTWFGSSVGFIYAADSGGTPAIYDIATGTWHTLTDPKSPDDHSGHATYDSSRHRLYVTGTSDEVWYYQF
jgi:hypothetical protein